MSRIYCDLQVSQLTSVSGKISKKLFFRKPNTFNFIVKPPLRFKDSDIANKYEIIINNSSSRTCLLTVNYKFKNKIKSCLGSIKIILLKNRKLE
jgi:hypothetical protein